MLKYRAGNGKLHSLGAKAKLACLFALTLAAIALPFEFAALFLPLGIALLMAAGIPLGEAGWKTMAVAAALVFAVRAAFQPGEITAFGLVRTTKGVYYGFLNAAYLAGMLLLVEVFVKTTRPSELARGLAEAGLPRKIAFSFSIALQALPQLQEKMARVRTAQTARGGGKNFSALLLPLLHAIFRRARKMAIALESRGFNPDKL